MDPLPPTCLETFMGYHAMGWEPIQPRRSTGSILSCPEAQDQVLPQYVGRSTTRRTRTGDGCLGHLRGLIGGPEATPNLESPGGRKGFPPTSPGAHGLSVPWG